MAAPELDLVFVCDSTSSMGTYIHAAQENIRKIIEEIKGSEKRDVQFALISYKDHCDGSELIKVFPWTTKTKVAFEYVSSMYATGGGDTPEAVADALNEVNMLNFRKSASKICVIVADAPPHGLLASGDSYPMGCPNGHDPIEIVHKLVSKEVIIYAVGCEPALGGCSWARDFFKAISYMTGGRYIALGNSTILPKIIIGGANEEMDLEKLSSEIIKEKEKVESESKGITEEEVFSKVTKNLSDRGVQCQSLVVDDLGVEAITDAAKNIAKCKTLAEVRDSLTKNTFNTTTFAYVSTAERSKRLPVRSDRERRRRSRSRSRSRSPVRTEIPAMSYQAQSCAVNLSNISNAQVTRVLNRKANNKR